MSGAEGAEAEEALRRWREAYEARHVTRREQSAKAQPPASPAKVVQLKIWPDAIRGVPNAFLRSALFAAIQGKSRRFIDGQTLGSLDGVTLKFTGQQLDQTHLDVWEQAVHLARLHPLGNVCHFKAHAFLKEINRSTGKADYAALDRDIDHLRACAVVVKSGSREYVGGLFQNAWRDKDTGEYKVILDPQIIKLFYSDAWTGINFEERLALKGKALAQWLHGFYASHAKPHPMKVETLRDLSGSTNKDLFGFKRRLKEAFAELAQFGFEATFDGDLVTVTREPTRAQKRHLGRQGRSPAAGDFSRGEKIAKI